mmetsp:Transcript_52124/g.46816  ORF Transcript_52124/g.46816 Transcript_52124/m.46816 type:complete len:316 (-) Transcript_52124:199-1146(-)
MKILLLLISSYYHLSLVIGSSGDIKPASNGCPNGAYAQCGGKTGNLPFTGDTCCPDGFVCEAFSPWYSQCNPPASSPIDPPKCPGNDFCTGKSDGNYEINDPNYPTSNFVQCVAGIAYCQRCPITTPGTPSLVYKQECNQCLYQDQSCPPSTNNIETNTISPPECPGDDFCTGKSNGNYEINIPQYSSSNFVQCSNGLAYCQRCPITHTQALVFNAECNECLYQNEVCKPAGSISNVPALIHRDSSVDSKPVAVTPAPVTPAPVTPAPTTPSPVAPAPVPCIQGSRVCDGSRPCCTGSCSADPFGGGSNRCIQHF